MTDASCDEQGMLDSLADALGLSHDPDGGGLQAPARPGDGSPMGGPAQAPVSTGGAWSRESGGSNFPARSSLSFVTPPFATC